LKFDCISKKERKKEKRQRKVNWKLLKCGLSEGWRKSAAWIRNMRKVYIQFRTT